MRAHASVRSQGREEELGKSMRIRVVLLATLLATLGLATGGRTEQATDDAQRCARLFPRPAALEPQIRFWRSIFTQYSTHQVVLHDAVDLDKIYEVLDFRPYLREGMSEVEVERLRRIETDVELERVRARLLRLNDLASYPDLLTTEEHRIYDLFRGDPAADRFLVAADPKRLRSQRGLRERFDEGLRISRRYLPEMERIFEEEGLPVELARLPLIESSFNLRAYSKVGAAGIWQFMPVTGRRFMRVDAVVDERRDPISSTRAAAEFLGRLYAALGSWPLAITAYNHGPNGIARAVDEIGTADIADIARKYRSNTFGFASRNFYAEFLAALDVERDYRTHFGELPREMAPRCREHRLDRSVHFAAAARLARIDADELADLNPALSKLVLQGRRPIPAGYRLRLPESGAGGFGTRLAGHRAEPEVVRAAARTVVRRASRRPTFVSYRVARGQTLAQIAKRHRVSVASLRKLNRLQKAADLRAGQTLKIPVAGNAA